MKIKCPSCHLTGNINSVDVPADGRNFECPRCKGSFFVAKPMPETEGKHLMSICPVCQYSTFTDEMFAVCPQCGTDGRDYQKMLLQKSAEKTARRSSVPNPSEKPVAALEQEQLRHEYALLNRSLRNPDFASEPPFDAAAAKPVIPLPIRITGWTAAAAGGILLCAGLAGLLNYYGKDWQALLSVPFLEPVSKTAIFFKYGFFPWLRTLTGIAVVLAATRFLTLKPGIPKILTALCWGSSGLILVQEAVEIVKRFLITSGSPSAIFYLDCFVSYLFKVSLWSVPFLTVIWLLRRDEIVQEYPEA
ncbi:MAG: zinc-ribbon domain-containing protein [Geobacteraceae bacterium]|jgi:predicted Zn finger-like uncharacterized protein